MPLPLKFTSHSVLTFKTKRYSVQQILSKKEQQNLQKRLDATTDFFIFLQLLGTYIQPDKVAMQKEHNALNVAEKYLTFEYISNKIIELNLDMKEIVANPTEENLTRH